MEDLFGINAHRQAVQENIEKAFDLGFDADSNIEGIEKAKHQVGDIHPNGRWVWTEWAPGKFDWKSLKGKHHKNSASSQSNQQTTAQQQITDDKEVASFMDKIKIFSNKYNDPSKVSVSKTPRGGWNVRYDGHRLGIFNASTLSEETANKQGWNEGSGEKFKQRWKNQHKDLSDETIQSYADNSRDVKYKQDVVDAAKELLEERKKRKKEEDKNSGSKSEKLSAFVDKTLKDIKNYAYGNFDDDRLKKAEKVLTENESLVKKFMSATFPAGGAYALSPAEKEIPISDDESIILSAYKTIDTTSMNPAYRGSTNYHYAVYHKVGYSKKLLSSNSYSPVFSARYGGTSSKRKQECKIDALIRYFHI